MGGWVGEIFRKEKKEVDNMLNCLRVYLKAFFGEEKGQALVEYALILVLISVVLIATLQLLEGDIDTAFQDVSTALQTR